MKFNVISGFTKQEIADWAKKHIISGSVITSDGLGCFPGFEEAGCTHMSIVTGGGPASVDIPDFKWVNTMIGNLKNAIRGTHHAISRKHIPRYLAEFCYRFNRRFRLGEMIERFLWVAASNGRHSANTSSSVRLSKTSNEYLSKKNLAVFTMFVTSSIWSKLIMVFLF
jgi:hypothetical protein